MKMLPLIGEAMLGSTGIAIIPVGVFSLFYGQPSIQQRLLLFIPIFGITFLTLITIRVFKTKES